MNSQKNILVVTYWNLDDGLIQAYTLPYLRIIRKYLPEESKIYLVTLEKNKAHSELIQIEDSIFSLQLDYIPFGGKAGLGWIRNIVNLCRFIRKKNIGTVHAWCTPAGMIGYILSVLTGRDLIIDSYEPHAEAMVENGEWKKSSLAFWLLFEFEFFQTKRAKYLIAASAGMKGYAREKYEHRKNNFFVKPACVDLDLFGYDKIKNEKLLDELGLRGKLVGVYAGKFGGIYLDQEVFDFFKVAADYWGESFRVLLLTSQNRTDIDKMADKAGLRNEIIISRFVPHEMVPEFIGLGDFALTPVKPVNTKRYCTPVKDGEYWALGLPVVITKNISDDSRIIEENAIGSVLTRFDHESYLRSIREIDSLLKNNSRLQLYEKIRKVAETYRNFEIAENIYREIYYNK